jgi:hypothetical protein
MLERLKRYAEAANAWEQVVALGPASEKLGNRITLVRLLINAGEYERAAAEADLSLQGLRRQPDPSGCSFLGNYCAEAVPMIGKDQQLSPSKQQELQKRFRGISEAALAEILRTGLRSLFKGKPAGPDKR